ncbi:Methylmalonic aciduria and homocystinuria type D [Trichostrongylus colubriformis]|uniref:Methylmalonic aciduria and homocystinuria type D n=1 Tax=Trichostrongylus colubriformis TaxID=6319 RepID=A0AAN8IQ20_TRICO
MNVTAVGPQMRAFSCRLRQFSTQPQVTHPSVVFVKDVQARQNSLLGPDKQFPLNGDVCPKILLQEQPFVQRSAPPSLMDQNTRTIQEVLSTSRVDADANYSNKIQETLLEEAQANAGDWPVELTVQECPRLLKKDMKHLFPGMHFDNVNVSVMNITQKTKNDMKAWSEEMEQEREMLTASFISSATAICTTLRRCGYWADFIDPSSGRPYLGKFTNHCLFETDDAYKHMGFRIEDLGCCKVLQHVLWGTHAFVGTLFTDAPPDCTIVKDVIRKVNTDEAVANQCE